MNMESIKQQIANLIGNNKKVVILDVGAYDGKDAAAFNNIFDDCEIHCFEADSRSQKLFEQLNSSNNNLTLWKCAIGSVDWKQVALYKSDRINRENWSASSSIREPKNHLGYFNDIKFDEVEMVDSSTLDMWAWFHNFDVIDLLWCDVNGAEQDVILGATDTLKKTRFVYLEYSDKELFNGQLNKKELLSLLPSFEELITVEENEFYGSVLLKNKSL